jgi:hypothetical protein
MLAMLYMIPYAVWGLNIFAGLTKSCNDGGVSGRSDCVNEYEANVVTNPTQRPCLYVPRSSRVGGPVAVDDVLL